MKRQLNEVNKRSKDVDTTDFPIPVPNYRFDQKNEAFKRRIWDKSIMDQMGVSPQSVKYQQRKGYRKIDYAFRNAGWSVEHSYAFGNSCGNTGLYSWDQVSEKTIPYIETDGPVINTPQENTRIVKKVAALFGADLVGICRTHPNLIYSHELNLFNKEHTPVELPAGCTHAIVMAVEMDYNLSEYSPNALGGVATGLGYSRQAITANWLSLFIRGLGYQAVPSGNDTALSIPLALASGLGELGRAGLLITKKYGPRVRLCKVFTDLPLEHDTFRPFGVKEFCSSCKKCARTCPSGAISEGFPTLKGPTISSFSGVEKWYINADKCYIYWGKNKTDCANCIRSCPFNKPSGLLHDTVRFCIHNLPIFNTFMIWMDDLLGYGRQSKKEFWSSP